MCLFLTLWYCRKSHKNYLILLLLVVAAEQLQGIPLNSSSSGKADVSYPDVKLERIAFGSCHSRGAVNKRLAASSSGESRYSNKTIWDTIARTVQPQTFLWTGDAIYPPMKTKGDTPLDVLRNEYDQMLYNETLGYAKFIQSDFLMAGIHGVWDDHDYGGNDRGRELTDKESRRDAYLHFLGVPRSDPRWERRGVYSSIEFGAGSTDSLDSSEMVRVIFLDTRWHRDYHCIPSVGSTMIPLGSVIACATRWITAGVNLPSLLPTWVGFCSGDGDVLGEEQWNWLEQQLQQSSASIHVVVSSIQVLTTNPVVESWGHFPAARSRLLNLLSGVKGVVLLSGDVHHAEIATSMQLNKAKYPNDGAIVEVTSSGMTHSCEGPFYGRLCRPILDTFSGHRFIGGKLNDDDGPSYFTQLNFGSIDVNWSSRTFEVKIHYDDGNIVLSTGSLGVDISAGFMNSIPECIDGHFLPFLHKFGPWIFVFLAANILTLVLRSRHFRLRPWSIKDKQV